MSSMLTQNQPLATNVLSPYLLGKGVGTRNNAFMWLWKLQKHQSSVCALLQAQSVHYKQQRINPSKEKKNYCSVRF